MTPSFLKNKLQKGFTLMEVMVAVSIFTIIVTVGIVALLTVNNTHKRSQIDRQAIDSLSYSLESMSRSLRTALEWTEVTSDAVRYVDQDGNDVSYRFESGAILKNEDLLGEHSITPENVVIENFELSHSGGDGFIQQYVQINIVGTITNGRQESRFAVQTSVSKRVLDSNTP